MLTVKDLKRFCGRGYALKNIGRKVFWFKDPENGLAPFWSDGSMTIFSDAPSTIKRRAEDPAKWPKLPQTIARFLPKLIKSLTPIMVGALKSETDDISHLLMLVDADEQVHFLDARRIAMVLASDDPETTIADLEFLTENKGKGKPILVRINKQTRAIVAQCAITGDFEFDSPHTYVFADEAGADETGADETDADETDADETDADEADADETDADETDADETDADETDADETPEEPWCTADDAPRPKLKVWRAIKSYPRFTLDDDGYTLYTGAINPTMYQAKTRKFEYKPGRGGFAHSIYGLVETTNHFDGADADAIGNPFQFSWDDWSEYTSSPEYTRGPTMGVWYMADRENGPTDTDWAYADELARQERVIGLLLIAKLADGSIWGYFLPGRSPDVRDTMWAYKTKIKGASKTKAKPEADEPEADEPEADADAIALPEKAS